MCFAVRHEIQFYPVAGAAVITGAAFANQEELSIWTLASSTFSFKVSEKIEFEGPVTMTPAGGGPNGFVAQAAANDGTSVLTNGVPDSGAIYVLPLPVAITKRQGIQMIEKKFNIGTTNIVDAINVFTGGKLFRAYIDGYNTRDVL